MKKLHKQILMIIGLISIFVLFDLSIYNIFTKRVMSTYSEGMQAKSIELDKYQPFDENSEAVLIDSETKLSGNLPVIDGAAALYPLCSSFVNALYPEDSVEFDGENFSEGSKLQMNNTRSAYKGVVDGDADVIICAAPSEEQLAYAKEKGVTLKLVPIGKEAFVFLVNKDNPVTDLTEDEIRGIYSGKYTNWKQLGGDNKLISALQRNEGSGSQTAMINFMNGQEMKKDYDTFLGSAIGFSFRFYVEGIVEDGGVNMLSINGVYPNKENIRNGNYAIINEIYAVYREDNDNPNVQILVDWILSEEGQKIIEDTGYVGVK